MSADLQNGDSVNPAKLPPEAVIFGRTSAMHEVLNRIERLVPTTLPVLIQGESGTGKEIVARFLHMRSNRPEAPFIKVNCAATPSKLLEDKLFGYQRVPSEGTADFRAGMIALAKRGTLFLEEIECLSWELQGKLLDLVEEGTFTRLEGHKEHCGSIRLICATIRNMHHAVRRGEFRGDLLYRIDNESLRLLPLRERKCDIPILCEYLLHSLAQKFGRSVPRLNSATIKLLQKWEWPGNLHELENWVARAIILGSGEMIREELRRKIVRFSQLGYPQNQVCQLRESVSGVMRVMAETVVCKEFKDPSRGWYFAEEEPGKSRHLLCGIQESGSSFSRKRCIHSPAVN